jgi:hypothetical protein
MGQWPSSAFICVPFLALEAKLYWARVKQKSFYTNSNYSQQFNQTSEVFELPKTSEDFFPTICQIPPASV